VNPGRIVCERGTDGTHGRQLLIVTGHQHTATAVEPRQGNGSVADHHLGGFVDADELE